MRITRGLGLVAAAAAIVMTAGFVLPSDAATASEPEAKEIAEGQQPGPVEVKVDGPVQVNFREITIPPGGSTGQHCHYGQLVGVVKSGELTHKAPDHPGGVHVYKAGDSLVEGKGYIHEGRNEGKEPVVLWVTYMTPKGKPLAESDLTKCDSGK
ncbi:cupin domain-containing protein [Streptomyces gamaensis]|uniref:Cupin domain-containing protein n=1 Tax=Streptomyces gamaensis TaxID=1763542 RepID=A0ABW0Z0D5_9ACTN